MKSVAVSLPMYTMKAKSVVSLISTMFNTPEIHFHLHAVEGAYIQSNRVQLVKMALDQKADYMFFMDHDVAFAPDTLKRLLAHDKDIVFAPYNGRHAGSASLVMGLDGVRVESFPTDVFPVSSGPTGCMLIKMAVFDKLPKPWFHVVLNDVGQVSESEDVWFCNLAYLAGISVWCDPSIKVGHYGEAIY